MSLWNAGSVDWVGQLEALWATLLAGLNDGLLLVF
jgi:hypothetical protein